MKYSENIVKTVWGNLNWDRSAHIIHWASLLNADTFQEKKDENPHCQKMVFCGFDW